MPGESERSGRQQHQPGPCTEIELADALLAEATGANPTTAMAVETATSMRRQTRREWDIFGTPCSVIALRRLRQQSHRVLKEVKKSQVTG